MITTVLLPLALLQSGGLVSKDVKVGDGAKVVSGDTLTVVYKGTLTSGAQFDQNLDGAPFVFTIGQGDVIPGWEKGLLGMKVGGKRHLTIPASLAYGSRPMQGIPANSTLNFDVSLLRDDKPGSKPKIEITDITKGTGKAAKTGDSVGVYYTGTFLNGHKFDSSYDHKDAKGKPSVFNVTLGQHGVVAGFEQGLTGMKVGGKHKVVIPYQLGYGEQGMGDAIPGKSTLVFTLEMKSIGK